MNIHVYMNEHIYKYICSLSHTQVLSPSSASYSTALSFCFPPHHPSLPPLPPWACPHIHTPHTHVWVHTFFSLSRSRAHVFSRFPCFFLAESFITFQSLSSVRAPSHFVSQSHTRFLMCTLTHKHMQSHEQKQEQAKTLS